MLNVAAELSPEDRRLLDALYDELIVGPAQPTETNPEENSNSDPAETNDHPAAFNDRAAGSKGSLMSRLTKTDRQQLEQTGLDIRARELVGDFDGADYTSYLAALSQAAREGAGKNYADEVAAKAGLNATPSEEIEGVALDRAAKSYLRATLGTDEHTAEQYLAAVHVVRAVTETQL